MAGPTRPRRLDRLAATSVLGRQVPVAIRFRARLLGLALLSRERAGPGLLIPRCRSVHTFGMRFTLDIVFLDEGRQPLSVHRNVSPCRVLTHREAAAVLELPASGERLAELRSPGRR